MNTDQAKNNVRLYYVYTMIKEPIFWGAVLVEFIMRISNMSISEVYFMEAVCIIVSIILEIPTGSLADHIGRKKTIIVGNSFIVLMIVIFMSYETKSAMWIADIVGFVGYTFISGADSALLFDSLKFLGREDDHRRIISRAMGYKYLLVAVCALVTGYMATIDLRLPIYACILPLACGWVICWKFVEPPYAGHDKYDFCKHCRLMKKGFVFVMRHSRVMWAIAFMVLVGVVGKLWFFSYNPYFSLVGLDYKNFGYIFCGLNVVAAISSHLTPWIHRRLGDFGSIVMVIMCLCIPITAMGTFVVSMAAWFVLMQNVVRGYFEPFMNDFLQQYLSSGNRATVLSVKSAICSSGQFFGLMVFGGILKTWPLPLCLQILGCTVLFGGIILIIVYRKIFVVE